VSAGRVFVTRRIPDAGLAPLHAAGAQVEVGEDDDERAVPPDVLRTGFARADVVLSLLTDPIGRDLLERAPALRGLANYAVGYDNIDVAAASALGIPVTNTPGILTESTADLAWTLILAVARRVPEAHAYTRAGRFRIWGPQLLLGTDIGTGPEGRRKTLGVIGFGRIGAAVARRARGFDMDVVGYDPRHEDRIAAAGATPVPLAALLARSDVVSIHASLNAETHHLIDDLALQAMKPGAILVNVARGAIVDEAALVRALVAGRIAGAGLDVYEREPDLADGLAALPNVVLLPHVGSATRDTRDAMARSAAANAVAHLRGEPAPDCVNPEVYASAAWRARARSAP
jgi:glyoxylate reductase